MKIIKAFLQLVRWPNMVFIIITQSLFYYCIIQPKIITDGHVSNLGGSNFILLIIASVCIAAAGNIINDYFDINIDLVNKPQKVIIGKYISRRTAILLHSLLSVVGIGISFYLDSTSSVAFLGLMNSACVLLLFIYSISLKRKLLLGNILISLLTAWVVLVVSFCELSLLTVRPINGSVSITRLTFLYAGFAFIISLIREGIKDMEDVEGDRRYGCRTMPIQWGLQATKVFIGVWLVVIIALLLLLQLYVLQFGWWLSAIYCVVTILLPLVLIFKQLLTATTQQHFHNISTKVKLVMLTGIFSMLFFLMYH